jgi:hypothetical protein
MEESRVSVHLLQNPRHKPHKRSGYFAAWDSFPTIKPSGAFLYASYTGQALLDCGKS